MRQAFKNIHFKVGNENVLSRMRLEKVLVPFSEEVIDFLDSLSKVLIKNPLAKAYPDVITFAFWCRKSSVLQQKKSYPNLKNRLGWGVIFHIAPSNVAVNFAYSMVAALLAGNKSIVRLPSKDFHQVDIICEALEKEIKDHAYMQNFVCLVQYGHEKGITDMFSQLCDIRVIWGGDDTIRAIRTSPLRPRATEITFADRYSVAVINADQYLRMQDKGKVAQDFYNDTYLTDQNACTSPKIVMWLGENMEKAQLEFWDRLDVLIHEKYQLQPAQAVGKLQTLCQFGAEHEGKLNKSYGNRITRITINELTYEIMKYSGHSGYFYEYQAKTLDELLPVYTAECQTLSYLGVDMAELQRYIKDTKPVGIDRIVPMGKTMDFSLVWDGYDLIERMSRVILF